MNDLMMHVVLEERLQRLHELQKQQRRRTRPVPPQRPPVYRRYQRRR